MTLIQDYQFEVLKKVSEQSQAYKGLTKTQQQQQLNLLLKLDLLAINVHKQSMATTNLMTFGDENTIEFVVLSAMRVVQSKKIKNIIKQVYALRDEVNDFLNTFNGAKYADLVNYFEQLDKVGHALTTNTKWDEQHNANLEKLIAILDELTYSIKQIH